LSLIIYAMLSDVNPHYLTWWWFIYHFEMYQYLLKFM